MGSLARGGVWCPELALDGVVNLKSNTCSLVSTGCLGRAVLEPGVLALGSLVGVRGGVGSFVLSRRPCA